MEQKRRLELLAEGDKLFNEFKDIALRVMEFSRATTHEGCNHKDTRTVSNNCNRMQLLYSPWHQRLQAIKKAEREQAEAMRATAKKKAAPIATPKETVQETKPEAETEQQKPLAQMTVPELRKMASAKKVKGYMKMKKDELLKALSSKK